MSMLSMNSEPTRQGPHIGDLEASISELRRRLELREAQLRECEHRIKNHLQILGSLARRDAADRASSAADLARNLTRRISAIAAAQDIWQPGQRTTCALDLIERVCRPYSDGAAQIRVSCDPDVELRQDQCIGVAMILNEAVCNSLKHAFASRPGSVFVEMRGDSEWLILQVKDDGVGFPTEPVNHGHGLQLMSAFARQLRGELRVHQGEHRGAALEIRIPR